MYRPNGYQCTFGGQAIGSTSQLPASTCLPNPIACTTSHAWSSQVAGLSLRPEVHYSKPPGPRFAVHLSKPPTATYQPYLISLTSNWVLSSFDYSHPLSSTSQGSGIFLLSPPQTTSTLSPHIPRQQEQTQPLLESSQLPNSIRTAAARLSSLLCHLLITLWPCLTCLPAAHHGYRWRWCA